MSKRRKTAKKRAKDALSNARATFETKLNQFRQLLNVIEGKGDLKQRLAFLLNPEQPLTSSRLSPSQVEFVTDAYLAADYYPEMEPLKELARILLLAQISVKGEGRKEAIDWEQASKDTAFRAFSILPTTEAKTDDGEKQRDAKT